MVSKTTHAVICGALKARITMVMANMKLKLTYISDETVTKPLNKCNNFLFSDFRYWDLFDKRHVLHWMNRLFDCAASVYLINF